MMSQLHINNAHTRTHAHMTSAVISRHFKRHDWRSCVHSWDKIHLPICLYGLKWKRDLVLGH